MLYDFLTSNKNELIARCKANAAKRFDPALTGPAIDHGVPLFIQQLTDTLHREQATPYQENPEPVPTPAPTEIGRAAALHGADLLRRGYTIDQVVHNYGDVCQSVTQLAGERREYISIDEFRTLNRCLDNAIADAVTSFGRSRQSSIENQVTTEEQRQVRVCNEQQRLIGIAIQSYNAIKTGNIGISGTTGKLLGFALGELRSLTEHSMSEIPAYAHIPTRPS
ncbi:MAG: hypothetical protein ABIP67_17425 [Burkholderiales bacterium]